MISGLKRTHDSPLFNADIGAGLGTEAEHREIAQTPKKSVDVRRDPAGSIPSVISVTMPILAVPIVPTVASIAITPPATPSTALAAPIAVAPPPATVVPLALSVVDFVINEARSSRQKIIHEAESSLQENEVQFEKAKPRLERMKLCIKIINNIFLVVCVISVIAPLIWPSLPGWTFWATMSGICVIGCITSFIDNKILREERVLKNEIVFFKTLIFSIKNHSEPHIVSEADIPYRDPRLASDRHKPEDPFKENRFSTSYFTQLFDRYGLVYGLVDLFGVGGYKLTTATRYAQRDEESDLEINGKHIQRALKQAKTDLLREGPSGIRSYLKKIGVTGSDGTPSIIANYRYRNYNTVHDVMGKEARRGMLSDSAHRFAKLYTECKRLYEYGAKCRSLLHLDSRCPFWEEFVNNLAEMEMEPLKKEESLKSLTQKLGITLYYEVFIEDMHEKLLGWSEQFSLSFLRRSIHKARREIRAAYSEEHPNAVQLIRLERDYLQWEVIFEQLRKKECSQEKRLREFDILTGQLEKLSRQFNSIGADQQLEREHKVSFFKSLFRRVPVQKFSRPRSFQELGVQRHLKNVDYILSRQQMCIKVASLVTAVALMFIMIIWSDNCWVNAGVGLAIILSGLFIERFKKTYVVKWEKQKNIFKMALFLLKHPQLMNQRHLPPLSQKILKVISDPDQALLYRALTVSRSLLKKRKL